MVNLFQGKTTEPKINSVEELLNAYKNGQRLFVDLEFENNESL